MGFHRSLAGMGSVYLVPSAGTPIALATVSGMTFDIKEDDVDLYGADPDLIDSFTSKRTIGGKITLSEFSSSLLACVTNGVTISAGTTIGATVSGTIPTTPFQVTITAPGGGTFGQVLGVVNLSDGKSMTLAATADASNKYAVSTNVVTFNTADAGDSYLIHYNYTSASADTTAEISATLSTSSSPKFGLHVYNTQAGKSWGIYVPSARIPGLSASFKRDGWVETSLDWKAVKSATNKMFYTYTPA